MKKTTAILGIMFLSAAGMFGSTINSEVQTVGTSYTVTLGAGNVQFQNLTGATISATFADGIGNGMCSFLNFQGNDFGCSNGFFSFIGSPYQMDRNDMGDQKGITILDLNSDKIDFVPNTYSPIFRKFRVVNEDDIDKLDELRGTKDYIDLAISNNLLINNRKLRRKLEVMLEKGNFASVEYIDDITKELVDGEEVNESLEVELDENGMEISVQLEYEDYIKEYILKQKYDNDKFKSGIVNEFDEVIRIYNENYKVKAD